MGFYEGFQKYNHGIMSSDAWVAFASVLKAEEDEVPNLIEDLSFRIQYSMAFLNGRPV